MRQGGYAFYFGFSCSSCCGYSYLFIFFYVFCLMSKKQAVACSGGEGFKKKVPTTRYARQRHCAAGGLNFILFSSSTFQYSYLAMTFEMLPK